MNNSAAAPGPTERRKVLALLVVGAGVVLCLGGVAYFRALVDVPLDLRERGHSSGAGTTMDWSWLADSYWYTSSETLPSLRWESSSYAWWLSQRVLYVAGYRGGYFWGQSVEVSYDARRRRNETRRTTFFGSLMPEGDHVDVDFQDGGTAAGRVTLYGEPKRTAALELQLRGPRNASHWGYWLQVTQDDDAWTSLPGLAPGVSVAALLLDDDDDVRSRTATSKSDNV